MHTPSMTRYRCLPQQSINPKTRFLSRSDLFLATISIAALLLVTSCRSDSEAQRVRPRQLRDVPAQRLAFTFTADVDPPPNVNAEEARPIPAIQQDFDERRKDEAVALLRTVPSPDGQRALALYSGQ